MEPQAPFSPPEGPVARSGSARIVWAEVLTYLIVGAVALALLLYFLLR